MKISSAYIEIINRCNLNCMTCYNRSGNMHKTHQIKFESFKFIVNRLINEFKCENISLAGGEPLLHPEINKFVEFLLRTYPSLSVDIITNGTINNIFLIDTYYKHQNFNIQVSLDGSNETINAITRGAGNFNKAINFVKKINRSNKHPILKMVISQNNISDIETYYTQTIDLNCIPAFAFVKDMGNAVSNWTEMGLAPQQKWRAIKTIENLNKKHMQNVKVPLDTMACPLSNPNINYSVLIKPTGDMQPCQILYDDRFSLGNILTAPTNQIHNRAVKLALDIKELQAPDPLCNKCVAKSLCKRGCIADIMPQGNNIPSLKNACDLLKLQFLGYELEKIISKTQ